MHFQQNRYDYISNWTLNSEETEHYEINTSKAKIEFVITEARRISEKFHLFTFKMGEH